MVNKIKNKITLGSYTLLQSLPGLEGCTGDKCEVTGLSQYLGWLYKFALAAAAFLAVLMIVIGGIQMIVGGASETARSDGKKRIEQAIWGLLLAITAWLVLYSINPDLVKTGLTIPGITIEAPAPPPGEFKDSSSPKLTIFADCMKKIPGLIITSTTDTNIQSGKCNPTDPGESFNDPNNCQHIKNSCHYGGVSCVSEGSYAIDVDDSIDYKTVAGYAASCGVTAGGAFDTTARCKNEGGWYHLSIGTWGGCHCDESMKTCASQG